MKHYRAATFQTYPLGWNKNLITLGNDAPALRSSSLLCHILEQCRSFKTLPDHSLQVATALKLPHEQDTVARLLEFALSQGLLVDEEDFYENLSACSLPNHPISRIAIITANRVGPCMSALDSFIHNTTRFSKQAGFTIMDDSNCKATCNAYLEGLKRRAYSASIAYAGRWEREKYVEKLTNEGIELRTARFALLGTNNDGLVTIGANRNCVLLDTLGESIFSADDDLVCRIIPHPQRSQQLRISCETYPREMFFFQNRKQVIDETTECFTDILGEHEKFLGRPIGGLISDSRTGCGVKLEHVCDHLSKGLLRHTPLVRATVGGVAGDSGGRIAKWLLCTNGQIRTKLLSSKSTYDMAMASREILGVARDATLSHINCCMAGNIGLDNRHELPPFLPVGRGEDSVFGQLGLECFADFFMVHVPFALFHDPEGARSYEEIPSCRIAELVSGLLSSCSLPPQINGFRALRLLGAYLEEIAALQESDLWEHLVNVVRRGCAAMMRSWQSIMDSFHDCPEYWRSDFKRWHEQMEGMLADASNCIPVEFRNRYPLKSARAKTRELILDLGKLLSSWPNMVEAARKLRGKDIRISTPIG